MSMQRTSYASTNSLAPSAATVRERAASPARIAASCSGRSGIGDHATGPDLAASLAATALLAALRAAACTSALESGCASRSVEKPSRGAATSMRDWMMSSRARRSDPSA
eukprot:scaffold79666_cov34-Tisochrysis_lutea.AAC.2